MKILRKSVQKIIEKFFQLTIVTTDSWNLSIFMPNGYFFAILRLMVNYIETLLHVLRFTD